MTIGVFAFLEFGIVPRMSEMRIDLFVSFSHPALMPRKLRLECAGAMYHVLSRGDRRENIVLDDVDRQDFLKTLAEACQKTGWEVHVY